MASVVFDYLEFIQINPAAKINEMLDNRKYQ